MGALRASVLSLHLAAASGALAWSPGARAGEAEERAEIAFVVASLPPNLDAESARRAIAREIGAPVTLASSAPPGQGTLAVRATEGRRVVLSYRAPDGRVTEREVELPDEPTRAAAVIALLAGNLVRDEAAELAAALRKHPDEPPPPAPPAPPPPLPAPPPPSPKVTSSRCAQPGTVPVLAGVSAVPFAGTGAALGTASVRRLSFNLLAGYTAGLSGFEIGVLANVERAFTCGVQIAGVSNVTTGPVDAVQIAGVSNVTTGPVDGVQIAGLGNVATGPVDGVQIAGLGNVATGPVDGVQIANVANFGLRLRGAQVGLVNVAAGEMLGAQTGLVNVATGAARGFQLGAVNVARRGIRGVQIGLVNDAQRSSFSLGAVSIVREGRFHVDLWGQESGLVMAGVKHGGDHFHTIYGVGIRPVGDNGRFAFAYGIGGHWPISSRLFIDLDTLLYSLHDSHSFVRVTGIVQARLLLGVRIVERFAIYAGPSYDVSLSPADVNPSISPYHADVFFQSPALVVKGWTGAVLGVQAL